MAHNYTIGESILSYYNYMKNCLFLLFLLITQLTVAQGDSTHRTSAIIYLEAGGAGGYGSLNYEKLCYHNKNFLLSLRAGVGTYRLEDYTAKFNPDILFPFAINACYGRDHKVELGVGQTLAAIVQPRGTDFKPKRLMSFHSNFSIGYRYQKNKNGLFFRCAYTPVIEFNRYFRHWAGISIGYCF
jgi:hypothetical protein